MADVRERGTTSGIRPLAIGYLVWHCCASLVVAVPLVTTSLSYAGILRTAEPLGQTIELLGVEVSVWPGLIATWVIVGLCALAGIVFGIDALRSPDRHRTTLLGRGMLVVCLLELLVSFVQANPLTMLASVVSVGLTGSLVREVYRVVRTGIDDSSETGVDAGPVDSPSVAAAPDASSYRLADGFAVTMVAWGALRVLLGLSKVFSTDGGAEWSWLNPQLGTGIVITLTGVWLIVTGRFGRRAFAGGRGLRAYFWMGIIGFALAVLVCVVFLMLTLGGWEQGMGWDILSAAADGALYAQGCYYAWRYGRGVS